jgi:nucleoside-diphosphate-sugar epimerase
MIHVEDLAQVLLAAALRGEAGRIYIGATGRPTPWIELARKACDLTGSKLPQPSEMPKDPNYRMFYEETKRCHADGLEALNLTLRYPSTLDALDTLATLAHNT